jgi:hypothetical protein
VEITLYKLIYLPTAQIVKGKVTDKRGFIEVLVTSEDEARSLIDRYFFVSTKHSILMIDPRLAEFFRDYINSGTVPKRYIDIMETPNVKA